MKSTKRMANAHGLVHYELTFHVPLLVGRLIQEPLVVHEQFATLMQLMDLFSAHRMEMIRKAHAADDIRIMNVTFQITGESANGMVVLDEQIQSDVYVDMDASWIDQSVQAWQQQMLQQATALSRHIQSWGSV